jgi:AcrR family transcriptional regulator
LSTSSTTSSVARAPLQPRREGGRQRVAGLLQAASDVFQEKGFEAATMSEIASRAGARIGSLYRFFPNKAAVADAVLRQQIAVLHGEYEGIQGRAIGSTPEQLADLLIDLLVYVHPRIGALSVLLEVQSDALDVRRESRTLALSGIAAALKVCAPDRSDAELSAIAAVVANNMKAMLGMALGTAPTAQGAQDELRMMNRLYLAARLS